MNEFAPNKKPQRDTCECAEQATFPFTMNQRRDRQSKERVPLLAHQAVACHYWHIKQFSMARRSYKFYISLLFWFVQKMYWPWLV